MENTGERHILSENFTSTAALFNHLMHIATYNYAVNYAKGKRVLDFGCGSGYGSYELAKVAKHVTAVDISSEAIEFAKENYKRENLSYCTISELFEEKFDILTSFQVIEHVSNDKEYLENLNNLLIPGGYLFISTPDKASRLFYGIQKPWNVFHLKEYSVGELKKLLSRYFSAVEILKIGSENDFALTEIERCKKQKFITLACTLVIYPNFLRVFLLKAQSKLYDMLIKFRKDKNIVQEIETKSSNSILKYSIEDIKFDNNLIYSTDILAICRKLE